MILNSTKYKNPQRTISGLTNSVTNADTIILCDTSSGIVYLNLLEIPDDQWNTTYKLYVVDKSNNAGTNAIAIFAPSGFTINNQSSLIINTDGGGVLIRVASNTGYLGSLTSAGIGGYPVSVINSQNPFIAPVTLTTALDELIVMGLQTTQTGNNVYLFNAFVSVTATQLALLISSNTLIANQWYNITDVEYGNFGNINAYVLASSTNTISTFGFGEFFDADYNNGGDYSGVSGFAGQLGIWTTALAPAIGNVCIWNNLHYKNITGVNTITNPSGDAVNWQLLTYSNTNGYIVSIDQIGYFNNPNRIVYRKDQFNNEVEYFAYGTAISFDKFPFGNKRVQNNKVLNSSYWDICNTIITERIYNNTLWHTTLLCTDLLYVNNILANNFTGTLRPLEWISGHPVLDIVNNNFSFCEGISSLKDCQVQNNNFVLSGIALNLSGIAVCTGNNVANSSLDITKTSGFFAENNLNFSNWIISASQGSETNNFAENGSVTISSTDGTFTLNRITQESVIAITTIASTGICTYNNLYSNSTLLISDTLVSTLGDNGVKGKGNTLYDATISIADFSGEMAGNLFSKVDVQITNFNGSIDLCEFTADCSITINDMVSHSMVGLTCNQCVYGSVGYNMPQSYTGGVYMSGLSTIAGTLDCGDPAIYDLATFTLTIPSELRSFIGKITLTRANGLTIKQILNTTDYAPYTFFNDNGTTIFGTQNVGVAVAGEMISNQPVGAKSITYRLNGSDYIVTNRAGLLVALTEINIFV